MRNSGFRGPSPNVGTATRFQPGRSGNPGGRPKKDTAAEIAQAVFEGNAAAIYRAMLKALKKGDARVFAALAERAYGKVPQQVSLGDPEGETLNFNLRVEYVSANKGKVNQS